MNRRNTRRRKNIIPGIDNKVFFAIIIVSVLIILICLGVLVSKHYGNKKNAAIESKKSNDEIEKIYQETNNEIGSADNYQTDKIIRLSFVGDTFFNSQMKSGNDNYDSIFTDAKEQLKDADLAIGTYSANIQTDDEKSFAKSVFNSGVDLLSLASNSSRNDNDYISEKKNNLNEIGFDTIGEYEESVENRVKIIEKKGVKIAVIAYMQDSNETGLNNYDSNKIQEDINYAKQNANFTIALISWKNSKSTNVSDSQKSIAQDIISKGANIVIGTNSYCLQKFQMTENEKGQAFIAYSVGNNIQTNSNENSKLEMILNLQIYVDKNGNSQIYKVDYVPMYMYQSKDDFRVMNIKQEILNYEKQIENQNETQEKNEIDRTEIVDDKTYKLLTNGNNQIKKILDVEQ